MFLGYPCRVSVDSFHIIFIRFYRSGNADASICTGTLFGVSQKTTAPNPVGTTSIPSSTNKKNNGEGPQEEKEEVEEELRRKQYEDLLVQSVLQPAKQMRAAGYWYVQ